MTDRQLPNSDARSPPRIAPGVVGRLLVRSPIRALTLAQDAFVVDGLRGASPLSFLGLRQLPVLRKGRVWSTLTFTIGEKTYTLRGLNHADVSHFYDMALTGIKAHLTAEFQRHRMNLHSLAREVERLSLRYVRNRYFDAWLPRIKAFADVLQSPIFRSYADGDTRVAIDCLLAFLNDPEGTRNRLNDAFVARALEQYQNFFETVERQPLTPMQRLACVVNEDHTLVLAGAGSGKTSVIVGRAGYLVKSGQARPADVLILAFSRHARQETDARIASRLPDTTGISAHTFHALGRRIIGQVTGSMPSVSTLAADEETFHGYLRKTVQQLSKENHAYGDKVRHFLEAYPYPYQPPDAFDSQEAYVRHLKTLAPRTLRGERVRSQEEVAIANFLALRGIAYEYEAPYKIDTATPTRAEYRPDFYLPAYDLYIEHFAIDEQGWTPSFIDQAAYTEEMVWKRALHREHHTRLIETYSYLFRDGRLFDELERQLMAHGVVCQPRALEEVLTAHADAHDSAHQLTVLIATFLTVFKSSGKTMEELRRAARAVKDGGRAQAFLEVCDAVLARYTEELRAKDEIDFNDMIHEAVHHLESGRYRSPFRFILVDELQDISIARAHLLRALLRNHPDATLFCVGDDWQSIFRFTGSDTTLTSRFPEEFAPARVVVLDRTFRFNNKICDFASTFIMKNAAQLKKTIYAVATTDSPAITLVQHESGANTAAIERCLEDIQHRAKAGALIYFIGRYRSSRPANLQAYGRRFPSFTFRYDTAHSSKGQEADYVIMLDVNDGTLGWPSHVQNDPLLQLVLPAEEPYPYAEERRLFYVSVTRARHHTYILSDISAPSVFVQEMLDGRNQAYEFNYFVTEGGRQEQAAVVRCPSCHGWFERKSSPSGEFYGCKNYPYCEERACRCEQCGTQSLVRQTHAYVCVSATCQHTQPICPQCDTGVLQERKGRYGPFLGCSNYRLGLCTYTEDLPVR
jgi:DNA helicase IV